MKFLFLFLFLLIIEISLANSLSISPAELYFNLETGKNTCYDIQLKNNESVNVIGSDKWTNKKISKGKLDKYQDSAENFKIDILYEKKILNLKEKIVKVCITGQEKGIYYGALMYHIDNPNGVSSGVGTWLWLNIGNVSEDYVKEENLEEQNEDDLNKITGYSVLNNQTFNWNTLIFLLLIMVIIIFVILFVMQKRLIKNLITNNKKSFEIITKMINENKGSQATNFFGIL